MNPGLLAAKVALGPVLLPQAKWLRRNALRLPEAAGPREGQIGEGEPVLRLLVLGDSSAAGVGLADQEHALASFLARALSQRMGSAVRWQLVARTGIDTLQARSLIRQVALQPADVVVTALGVNDVTAQAPAARFLEETALLWGDLQQLTGARWAVFCGLPPMHLLRAVPHPLRWYLGRYAAWLDGSLREWTQERGLGYCELRWASDPGSLAEDGFHPGARLYPEWSARLADLLADSYAKWGPPMKSTIGDQADLPVGSEPVGGLETPAVRPEPVEGPSHSRELVARPQPVEVPETPAVRPELVEVLETPAVRPELVEGQSDSVEGMARR